MATTTTAIDDDYSMSILNWSILLSSTSHPSRWLSFSLLGPPIRTTLIATMMMAEYWPMSSDADGLLAVLEGVVMVVVVRMERTTMTYLHCTYFEILRVF